jgi:hypothetical protein
VKIQGHSFPVESKYFKIEMLGYLALDVSNKLYNSVQNHSNENNLLTVQK